MSDLNSEIKNLLINCKYNQDKIDYLTNEIIKIINFPKKERPAKYFFRSFNEDKIIMIWYPTSIKFVSKSYNVPIQIFLLKNYPIEAPHIFLEVVEGSAPNPKNKDVDQYTKRIMTNALKIWNQNSNIEDVMKEIVASFTDAFPIYRTKKIENVNLASNFFSFFTLKDEINKIIQESFLQNQNINYNHINIINNSNYNKNEEFDNFKHYTLFVCPDCRSFVEILNVDKKNIEIKCLNCIDNNEKGTKTILIKDYLKFLFSLNVCCLCKEHKDIIYLYFCTQCKNSICNNCIDIHFKEYCNKKFLLEFKNRGTNCFSHPNNNNQCFCDQCKRHICPECIKSKEHKGHEKTDFVEIEPTIDEKEKFMKINKLFKIAKTNLEKEKNDKIKEIEDNSKEIFDLDIIYKDSFRKIENDKISEIENEQKKCEQKCDKLYKVFLHQIELQKENLKKKIEEINKKYEDIYNKAKMEYENNLKTIHEKNVEIQNIGNDFIELNDIDNFFKMNEIIDYSLIQNKNNYFNNINFNKLLSILDKNAKEIIKELIGEERYNKYMNEKENNNGKSNDDEGAGGAKNADGDKNDDKTNNNNDSKGIDNNNAVDNINEDDNNNENGAIDINKDDNK